MATSNENKVYIVAVQGRPFVQLVGTPAVRAVVSDLLGQFDPSFISVQRLRSKDVTKDFLSDAPAKPVSVGK